MGVDKLNGFWIFLLRLLFIFNRIFNSEFAMEKKTKKTNTLFNLDLECFYTKTSLLKKEQYIWRCFLYKSNYHIFWCLKKIQSEKHLPCIVIWIFSNHNLNSNLQKRFVLNKIIKLRYWLTSIILYLQKHKKNIINIIKNK